MHMLLNQSGGIVYKLNEGDNKYKLLMITSKNNYNEWLFPKGDIDEGETPQDTAKKEVLEEAGVITKVDQYIGKLTYTDYKFTIELKLFLMKYLGDSTQKYEKRLRKWVDIREVKRCHHLGKALNPIIWRVKKVLKKKSPQAFPRKL